MAGHPLDHPGIALVIGLFGASGIGLSMMLPDQFLLGALICYGCAVITGIRYAQEYVESFWRRKRGANKLSVIVVLSAFILEIAVPSYLIYRKIFDTRSTPPSVQLHEVITPTENKDSTSINTVRQLFDSDFDGKFKHSRDITISLFDNMFNKEIFNETIRRTMYLDFSDKSMFMGFYLPESDRTVELAGYIADSIDKIINSSRSEIIMEAKHTGDSSSTKSTDLTFTGLVYIYYESRLTLKDLSDIDQYFSAKGLKVQLRGIDYALAQWTDKIIRNHTK